MGFEERLDSRLAAMHFVLNEIKARLGSGWIPTEYIEDFVREILPGVADRATESAGNFGDAGIFLEVISLDQARHAGTGKKLKTIQTLLKRPAKALVRLYRIQPAPQIFGNAGKKRF